MTTFLLSTGIYIISILLNRWLYFHWCKKINDTNPILLLYCFFFFLGTLIITIINIMEKVYNSSLLNKFFTPKHLR